MPDFRQAACPAEVDLLLLGQGWRPVVPGAGKAAAASSRTSAQSLPGAVSPGGSKRRAPRLSKVPIGVTAPSRGEYQAARIFGPEQPPRRSVQGRPEHGSAPCRERGGASG